MKNVIACMVGVVVFVVPLCGKAGIVEYTDRATFLAEANIESTEDFDSFANYEILGNPATIDGVVYGCTAPAGRPPSFWRTQPDTFAPDSMFLVPYPDTEFHSLTFGAGNWTNSIGFDLDNPAGWSEGSLPYVLTVTTRTGERFTRIVDNYMDTSWQFFGYTSPDGIVRVAVDDYPEDTIIVRARFDNVSRGEIVPEPSTLALLSMGVAGLLFCYRRRR